MDNLPQVPDAYHQIVPPPEPAGRCFPLPEKWVHFANVEAAQLLKFAGGMDPALLRRVLVDALRETHGFPLRTEFQGLVIGQRSQQATSHVPDAQGKSTLAMQGEQRYLEVVPSGCSEETYRLLGPVLVPTDRPLQEGSLLSVSVTVRDPQPNEDAALVAESLEMLRAHVAVEP